MDIPTKHLDGVALDWAVAKAAGKRHFISLDRERVIVDGYTFQPSTSWTDGGPIIDREQIDIHWVGIANCRASIGRADANYPAGLGPTPLIAAMRCYVACTLGASVNVPDELKIHPTPVRSGPSL